MSEEKTLKMRDRKVYAVYFHCTLSAIVNSDKNEPIFLKRKRVNSSANETNSLNNTYVCVYI